MKKPPLTGALRARKPAAYRCFLPDLTGLGGRFQHGTRGSARGNGARGIRTLGTRLGHIRFPSAHLQPLGHRSIRRDKGFALRAAASMPPPSGPPRSLPAASSRLIRPKGRRSLGSNPRAVPLGILGHSPNPYNLIRRDRDSNPGCRRPTQRISNPPDSTTLAPLHLYALEDSNLRPLGPQPNALSS